MFIVPADTAALGGTLYKYEVEVIDGSGAESTVLRGKVTITPSILP